MANVESMKSQTFDVIDYETWKTEVEKSLKGKPFEKLFTTTYEGIVLKPLYTRADVSQLSLASEWPGFGTHIRGSTPLGYVERAWYVAQQLEGSSPQALNRLLQEELSRGLKMINLSKVTSRLINQKKDMRIAFEGISLESIPLFIQLDLQSVQFIDEFIAYCQELDIDMNLLTGTIGFDIIRDYLEEGELPSSIDNTLKTVQEAMLKLAEAAPQLQSIIVNGDVYHNGGAHAVQELAFSIATAVEYINSCKSTFVNIDELLRKVKFHVSVGSQFFMEIAKLRALKRLWTTVATAYGASEQAKAISIHASTSSFTKTVYDPYVNMLRATNEAFAATIGGIDSMHVSSFDTETVNDSSTFSRRIARNTQLILQQESYLNKVVDPAGGSWYVESLTDELATKAWKLFQQIEQLGGMTEAIKQGFVQKEIQQVYDARVKNVAQRKEKIVGTNMYVNATEPYKGQLTEAETTEKDIVKIPKRRLTAEFESIRLVSEEYERKTGVRPTVTLINLGPIPAHKARADFISGFFGAGGFVIEKNDGHESIDSAVSWANQQSSRVFIICGKDDAYENMAASISAQLKQQNPSTVVYVAGKQEAELEKQLKESGVDDFIHIRSNCYETIKSLQQTLGVI
ncbi:methylmalonyl-CoA mutase [Bacillus sp. HMF5848]|uniref:methylmalonyl-CoA mutase family protein n=1 Tax=Bacillus sp. HMF5848 TaxID=2495421 RepID=UPI000F7765C7|nr:methylmalonyl-CoA mutase family protein [Bacillus sp. HMF5848]RSK27774.1 methylmalonyl-CoA mutase [Bacillus sp. HMF5848]